MTDNSKNLMYVADGHSEKVVLNLLKGAGFNPVKSERGYEIKTNSKLWDFKQIRPQDQPLKIAEGYGDMGIVGQDIFKEFMLKYPSKNRDVSSIYTFDGRPTKLEAVVSNERYPDVTTLVDFFEVDGNISARIASEYPEITKQYIFDNFGLTVDVYKPAGKTEALLVGERPEADLIVETVETGETLEANGCKTIETLMTSQQIVIVNSDKYLSHKTEINDLLEQFKGVVMAENHNDSLKELKINVIEPEKIDPLVFFLENNGYDPSIAPLASGGSDVYVVLPESEIKEISPELNILGGGDMIVTPIERLLYPTKK